MRIKNLELMFEAMSSISVFARATGLSYPLLTAAKRQDKALGTKMFRQLELALGLPERWMEQPHDALPEDVRAKVRQLSLPDGREDSPEMSARRLANIDWLAGPSRGAKTAFSTAASWHPTDLYNARVRGLSTRRAKMIETNLGLPPGWLDAVHDHAQELPEAFEDRLGVLRERAGTPAAPLPGAGGAPTTGPAAAAGMDLSTVGSPVVRALVEKLIEVGRQRLLTDARAVQLLQELVALQEHKTSK